MFGGSQSYWTPSASSCGGNCGGGCNSCNRDGRAWLRQHRQDMYCPPKPCCPSGATLMTAFGNATSSIESPETTVTVPAGQSINIPFVTTAMNNIIPNDQKTAFTFCLCGTYHYSFVVTGVGPLVFNAFYNDVQLAPQVTMPAGEHQRTLVGQFSVTVAPGGGPFFIRVTNPDPDIDTTISLYSLDIERVGGLISN